MIECQKFFKDDKGCVFAYAADGSDDKYINQALTQITAEEAHHIANPSHSVAYVLERVKVELRTMRAPMLDALAGIAGRATRAGSDGLAAEADALAAQLLDITADAGLNAATTHEAMRAAGVAAYQRIAASASTELAKVFKEITGA